MDVIPENIIISALISGAAATAKGTASQAVKDAYSGLKALVQRRFLGKPSAEVALAEAEKDSETWETPLAKAVSEYAIDKEILALAQQLLQLLQTQQAAPAKYNISMGQAQGTVIGDNAQVTQHFGDQTVDRADESE